MLAAWRWGW